MPVKKTEAPAPAPSMDLRAIARADTAESAGSAIRLLVAPNDPFFLRHHPGQWELSELDGQPVYLPLLGKQSITPGVDGMQTAPPNAPASEVYGEAQYRGERVGWRYLDPTAPIPADCLPTGISGGYRQVYPAQHPRSRTLTGNHYAEAWSIPVATVPGQPQRWEFDRASYARYRAWLVSSGQIQPPIPSVVADLVAAAEGRLDRVSSLTGVDASSHERMVAKRQKLVEQHADAVTP